METKGIGNNCILHMVDKGYTITRDGRVLNPKGIEIKGSINKGYRKIGQKFNGKNYPISFHRLQGYFKFGDIIFNEYLIIRHLDGNSLNNSWENIGLGTQLDNIYDIPPEKRKDMASHPKHNHHAIISDYESNMSYKQLMEKYNISSKGTVSYIINGSIANQNPLNSAPHQ